MRDSSWITDVFNLETAVEAGQPADRCVSRPSVASYRREAGQRAQLAPLQEGLEGSREDRPPALQARQLLRIFYQLAQKHGDGAKRLGVRTRHRDRRLSRMPNARRDG